MISQRITKENYLASKIFEWLISNLCGYTMNSNGQKLLGKKIQKGTRGRTIKTRA